MIFIWSGGGAPVLIDNLILDEVFSPKWARSQKVMQSQGLVTRKLDIMVSTKDTQYEKWIRINLR